jgi:ubiquinone biosynthesis protein COQ9
MNTLQQQIIGAALPNVVFDGWSMETLRAAAKSLGMSDLEADRAFANGIIEALNVWTAQTNQNLADTLASHYNLESMKIRDRIATGVMVKLRSQQAHKEAVRRALTIYAMPWHAADGMKSLYDTLDVMWRAAGDTSTDWNFYSKRMLLAKVYMSTLSVWLGDESDDQRETEAFLHRRIEDVMRIQKAKFKLKGWRESLDFSFFQRA